MDRKKLKWLKGLVLSYFLTGIALYFSQTFFLFHPQKLAADYTFHFNTPFEEVKLSFTKGDTIDMVKFFPMDSVSKGVVIYLHGNMQNINRYAKYTANFTNNGYEVWMSDYPGFGKSTGRNDEAGLYAVVESVYQEAIKKYPAGSIIIYGKSFGTGLAAYIASAYPCKKLILETPYYSIPDLFFSWAPIYPASLLCNYKIPVNAYLKKVKAPITIFHGDCDGVIFYKNAVKLKTALKNTDEFITIPDGTHNNLNDFELFHHKLDSLLR
jgi:uncharacterized protein